MGVPKPAAAAVKVFEGLAAELPKVTVKSMFGQPAAFANGHMFFGVFGEQVFVRLSEKDRASADAIPGFVPFEPMPGRAMKEYRVLPSSIRASPSASRKWVARSQEYAASLAPKKAKPPKR
ncbi:MAG: TfoX/Sxy family protein [Thermoplasmata archaeon]|nr:TfoX/Sxy family protein [Thermoplasmata archaeon]